MTSATAVISGIEERLLEPTARGLAQAVTAAVRDGVVTPGSRLPPIRVVARELAISPTTVTSCWRLLASSGVVRADGRRGTVVLDRSTPAPSRYQAAMSWQSELSRDLSTGIPDGALLPSLDRLMPTPQLTSYGYLTPSVLPELREVALHDWPYPTPDVAVVDGAMDGVDLVVRTQVRRGDRVAIEHPAYTPFVDLLESVSAHIVPLEMDDEGIRVGELERALGSPLSAVLLQPRAQNPTGVTMSPERARALSRVLDRSGVLVVEDDSTGAIANSDPLSLGRWLPEQVAHVRSYSKSHGPDLRIGVMSGPETVLQQVGARRRLGQGWTSRLLQQVLVMMLTDPAAVATVASARETYAARRRTLVDALARSGIEVRGEDGLNIWVPVADEASALVRLAREGIGVAPGNAFILDRRYPHHIRVTAGLVPEAHGEDVATALAAAALPRPLRNTIVS